MGWTLLQVIISTRLAKCYNWFGTGGSGGPRRNAWFGESTKGLIWHPTSTLATYNLFIQKPASNLKAVWISRPTFPATLIYYQPCGDMVFVHLSHGLAIYTFSRRCYLMEWGVSKTLKTEGKWGLLSSDLYLLQVALNSAYGGRGNSSLLGTGCQWSQGFGKASLEKDVGRSVLWFWDPFLIGPLIVVQKTL